MQAYAVASEDMDSLTFGARRFLRHLTDLGFKKSPVTEFEVSRVTLYNPPSFIYFSVIDRFFTIFQVLEELRLTMDQFIDLCILSGCDYCENIRGSPPFVSYSSSRFTGPFDI